MLSDNLSSEFILILTLVSIHVHSLLNRQVIKQPVKETFVIGGGEVSESLDMALTGTQMGHIVEVKHCNLSLWVEIRTYECVYVSVRDAKIVLACPLSQDFSVPSYWFEKIDTNISKMYVHIVQKCSHK